MSVSVLKLHPSRVLDMYLEQRAAIKNVAGTVQWCPPGSPTCQLVPRLTGKTANKLRAYWAKEITLSSASVWSRLVWLRRIPPKMSDGMLTPKTTNEFWQRLKDVAIELDVYISTPSKFELVLEEIKNDLIAVADKISGFFTIPDWLIYGSIGLGVLWVLKKR